MSQPLESPKFDVIHVKKGHCRCNLHNKNNEWFSFLETEIKILYSYLGNVCVHLTSNAEIFKMVVDR